MANCPKCGAHLKITDWRPECPKCGVNMVYYGMEDRLLADAEKAEAEHARFQKRIDRLKASTVGGKLQIVRIICAFLPIAALFLPLAKINLSDAPYMGAHLIKVDILKIVDFFSSYLDVNGLLAAIKSPIVGKAFIAYAAAIVLLVLSIVMILFTLFRLLTSALKKSCVKNVVINSLAVLFVLGSIISFSVFSSSINAVFPTIITASVGFGAYIYALLFVPTIVVNLLFSVHPMNVKYKEQPVYEAPSSEIKEAEAEIAAELKDAIGKEEEKAVEETV